MDRGLDKGDLDRHITGNYGEDQFSNHPCEMCGKPADDESCICPECPECGMFGDPFCYFHHGLVVTQAQIDSYYKAWEEYQKEIEAEREYFGELE